jgi:hypothetical protein
MRKLSILILSLLCLFSLAFANFIFQEYSATPSNNSVVIEWLTKSEDGVNKFTILRSTDDQNFFEIGNVLSKKQAQTYYYTDENVVFKDTQTFFYKLRAVRADNSLIEETQSLIVHPNISGIYRTWGAIKAMFR